MEIIKNKDYELTIEDITLNGEGVGKIDGYALFVKDAIVGDRIIAKATKIGKTYGYGRLMEIISPSPDRVAPPCPVAKACGGCTLMAMSYPAQLSFKTELIRNNLARIGGLTDIEVPPVLGMDEPFRYRNKAQFPVGYDRDGNIVTGFYAGRTHSIIPCDDCLIGSDINAGILAAIKSHMLKYNIKPYNEELHTGLVRHILIRIGAATGQIMVCIVINGDHLKAEPELVKAIQNLAFSDDRKIASIMLNYNTRRTNVILGTECRLLAGNPYIEDYIGDIRYRISPLSFYQVNPKQTKVLYDLALSYADLHGTETVWDLYCGIGTISLFLARNARKVYGVEIVPQAIEDAKANAALNGITNAEFYVGRAEDVLPAKYASDGISADVIVVDPPRKGCAQSLLDTILSMAPKRVVYVSCDSATLARDLKYLTAGGYQVEKVQGVDQFCHSGHVETVVLLSQLKQKPDDYINVTIELDDVDITSAETKATYDEIKKYVSEHNAGMKVSNLYISQVKRKCGIEVGKNLRVATRRMDCLQGNSTTAATDLELVPSPNLPKNEDSRQPQCPEDKERAIVEALEHFKMIQLK